MLTDETLLLRLKETLPRLENLLERMTTQWGYEEVMYRFYHMSFKVYSCQSYTEEAVEVLQAVVPGAPLNDMFMEMVRKGTKQRFNVTTSNTEWMSEARAIVEAFLHAKYMLEMAVKYARALDSPCAILPYGWASVLHLYNIR